MSPSAGSGRVLRLLLASAAGAATVFGYAPFHVALLPLATLAVLFWLWQHASTPRDAALEGGTHHVEEVLAIFRFARQERGQALQQARLVAVLLDVAHGIASRAA